MGILSGIKKIERYIKQSDGYKKISQWTSSQSVEFDDGTNLEEKMKDIEGKIGVTGIKGNSESTYRKGNVNITPENIGLGNVGNYKAVSTIASQGLSDTEKSNARANIGAGTSSFSGSYNDLSNKPTIPDVSVKVNKSGDTMSGTLASSKLTNTYLAGNQGEAIINSTSAAGGYTMLDKLNSTNGYFTDGVYKNGRVFYYTAKSTVDAKTNNVTKTLYLLDESGNSQFPGTVTASSFSGNASSATTLSNTLPVSKGGTGATSLASGQALVGNGTGAVTTRAIDTTRGGSAGSTSLITSGAVEDARDFNTLTQTGTSAKSISSIFANTTYREMIIELSVSSSSTARSEYVWHVPLWNFTSSGTVALYAGYKTGNYEGLGGVTISNRSTIQITNCIIGNTEYKTTAKLTISYR